MPRRYKLGCTLTYQVKTQAAFIFHLEVARLKRHLDVMEHLVITPDYAITRHSVHDINTQYIGLHAHPGPLMLQYEAEVSLDPHRADPSTIQETPVQDLPLDILPFLLPSRFVPSDRLSAFALREFGHLTPGFNRVTAICNWLNEQIDYRRGASNEQTIASESLLLRAGVCRDFAHLGIAFCRALEIPARYVSCYAYGLKPADFHAVFEAYLDGRWWLFDATRQAHLDGLIRIGVGRDAAEVAFCSPFGGEVDCGPVEIAIECMDGEGPASSPTTEAISMEEPSPNARTKSSRLK